mmetsp:Transcript_27221/g.78264  ORF Transcript_27221/g.78264 Transcript_27221/m.78264 type:complete len:255 (+) Transcript_27221:1050-1814(+)
MRAPAQGLIRALRERGWSTAADTTAMAVVAHHGGLHIPSIARELKAGLARAATADIRHRANLRRPRPNPVVLDDAAHPEQHELADTEHGQHVRRALIGLEEGEAHASAISIAEHSHRLFQGCPSGRVDGQAASIRDLLPEGVQRALCGGGAPEKGVTKNRQFVDDWHGLLVDICQSRPQLPPSLPESQEVDAHGAVTRRVPALVSRGTPPQQHPLEQCRLPVVAHGLAGLGLQQHVRGLLQLRWRGRVQHAIRC